MCVLNDGRLSRAERSARLGFLPRPWLTFDESQVSRDLDLDCDSVRRVGDEIFARGRMCNGDGVVSLPYWHKVVRV